MEHGRRDLGVDRIVAIANPGNDRSFKLLEKLGLRFERMIKISDEEPEIKLFTQQ